MQGAAEVATCGGPPEPPETLGNNRIDPRDETEPGRSRALVVAPFVQVLTAVAVRGRRPLFPEGAPADFTVRAAVRLSPRGCCVSLPAAWGSLLQNTDSAVRHQPHCST